MASGSNEEERKDETPDETRPEVWPTKMNTLQNVGFFAVRAPVIAARRMISRIRHGPFLDRIYPFVEEHAQKGDPASVIQALDTLIGEQKGASLLPVIGDIKGPIVKKIIEEKQPMVSLELGSLIGYSAINAASVLPEGARYYCVEPREDMIEVLLKLVDFAGVQDKVHVIKGYSTDVIPRLKAEHNIDTIDYVFLDHVWSIYKSDLILIEENGLLKPGSVIVADNVIISHGTEYLEYVRKSPKYRSEYFDGMVGYENDTRDGLEKSTVVEL